MQDIHGGGAVHLCNHAAKASEKACLGGTCSSAAVLQEKPMQTRLQCRRSCAGSFGKRGRLGRAHLALPLHAVKAGTACPWLQQMQQQLAEAAWLLVLVAPGEAPGCSPFPACACWLAPSCWLCSDSCLAWQQRPHAAGSVPEQHRPPAWPLSPAAPVLPHVHLQHDRAAQLLTSRQLAAAAGLCCSGWCASICSVLLQHVLGIWSMLQCWCKQERQSCSLTQRSQLCIQQLLQPLQLSQAMLLRFQGCSYVTVVPALGRMQSQRCASSCQTISGQASNVLPDFLSLHPEILHQRHIAGW